MIDFVGFWWWWWFVDVSIVARTKPIQNAPHTQPHQAAAGGGEKEGQRGGAAVAGGGGKGKGGAPAAAKRETPAKKQKQQQEHREPQVCVYVFLWGWVSGGVGFVDVCIHT